MSHWLASTSKQQQHSMSVQKHSNNNIYNLFLFLSLFFLFTPIHSQDTDHTTTFNTTFDTTINDTIYTITDNTIIISQINELIKNGGIERGKTCADMGLNNCTYIDTSHSDSHPYADINDCNSTKVCIITCDEQYSCSDWHIYAAPDMILVIDCIAPGSCKQLSIHATQASFVHLQANNINSITNSQIQCPHSDSHSQSPSCVICGRCTDMHGDEHCEPTETTLSRIFNDDYPVKSSDAMMKHLSIYAEHGYSDVTLLCDLWEVGLCVTHSVILCEHQRQQQTCWIAIEYTYDQRSAQYAYVCEDDVQCNTYSYNTTDEIHATVADVTDSSEDPDANAANISDSQGKDIVTLLHLLRDILKKKNMILYVSITVCTVVCLCGVLCVLVCKCPSRDRERENDAKREFKFVQKQQEKQNVKYNKNSYKLCKKCTAKSCLCYYLSCCCCCYCWQCLRRSSQQNTHLNNSHNHSTPPKHMHVNKDNVNNNSHTDEPQTINPLSIDKKGGIIPSFFIKNRDKQLISPSHSGTNTVELVVIANNNLHPPAYLSHIQQQSHTTTIAPSCNLNKLVNLQQQQSLSSQHRQCNTERGTFSRSFETQMHLQQRSCSHTSHHDGLEEQAAKKIGDAKLGTNTGHNTQANSNTPNHNHTPFLPNDACHCPVTAKHDTDTGTLGAVVGGDFAYALKMQQQQIFDAVLVGNTPTTTKNTPTDTPGHTPPTNGDTPYTITVGNVHSEAQHVPTQTIAADGDIINLGGGFAIGPEESTSSTHTSITDSRSSQTFDPEHPSCYDQ